MPPSLSCPLADTSVYMLVGTADFWCSKILWQSKRGFRECIIIRNGLGFQSILGALGALYSKNSSIVLTHNVRKRARRRWWKQKGQSIQCDKGFPFSDTPFTHWTQVRSPSECDSVKAVRSTSTEEVADLERAGQIQGYDLRAPISSKGLPNIQVFQQSKPLGLYKKIDPFPNISFHWQTYFEDWTIPFVGCEPCVTISVQVCKWNRQMDRSYLCCRGLSCPGALWPVSPICMGARAPLL